MGWERKPRRMRPENVEGRGTGRCHGGEPLQGDCQRGNCQRGSSSRVAGAGAIGRGGAERWGHLYIDIHTITAGGGG
jgi:hypothetical protein